MSEESCSRPSVSRKPSHKHLDRKPECWPAERALVSPASEGLAQGGGRRARCCGHTDKAGGRLPFGLGMWVQGCERKSIIEAGPEGVLPGGRSREQEHGV